MFQYGNKIGFKFSIQCPFHFSEAKKTPLMVMEVLFYTTLFLWPSNQMS